MLICPALSRAPQLPKQNQHHVNQRRRLRCVLLDRWQSHHAAVFAISAHFPQHGSAGETASGPAVHSSPPPLKTVLAVADSCGSCWLLSLCVGVQLFFYIIL